jgi:tetratricopeptide (TPR) repeat protein
VAHDFTCCSAAILVIEGSATQLGFIAQQAQQIFPNLVATTSPTALTPDGTLSVNYIGLVSPIVSAIQALSAELSSIENTVAGAREDQPDRAIEDLDQAIRLNPNYALAFSSRGLAYARKGQPDRAIQDYDQAIRLNPKYADAFSNRGAA